MSETEPRLLPKSGQPAPVTVEAYRRQGGYQALERALKQLSPEVVLGEIRQARLRGRGGAGVITAEKMALVGRSADDQKYVVCNAYDADPRARISSTLLSQNPHLVIEGIALAAYTVGASEAFLYLRGADKALVAGLEGVLQEATTAGLLGRSVLGTPFALSITLVGADMGFMGGEESTLLQIIKGRPPKAQQRPPYPTQYGIDDRPTLIANVETIANLPIIVAAGGEAFSRTGSARSSGTKLFTVIGPDGAAPAVVEVRIGATIEEALTAANLATTAATARAVVVGGLEGGVLPVSLLKTPLDFESIEDTGAIIGSSVIEILPQGTCMVNWATLQAVMLSRETCGKCVPCRVGVKRIAGTLETIQSGMGNRSDLDLLQEFSRYVPDGSLCGFGINAVNPVVTAMKNFAEDFQAHLDGQCPTGSCQPMRSHRFVTKHVL